MNLQKDVVILGSMLIFTGLISGQNIQVDSDKIESISVESDGPFNGSVNVLNRSEYEELNNSGLAVYEALNVDIGEDTRIEIAIKEDQKWATNFIKENPAYFNGPGHKYTPGLWRALEGENYEFGYLSHSGDQLKLNITESGNFYFIYEGTNSSREQYIGPEGLECGSYITPPEGYQKVDECSLEEDYPYLEILAAGSALIICIFLFVRAYRYVKTKLLLRNINSRVEELESDPNVSKEELEELYEAMNMASEGEYDKASEILEKLN